jgi:tRNA pseudouridine55 synthase
LPICIGKATKVAEYITDAGKTYEGEVTLGFSTTTEDASGEVVETRKVDRVISKSEIIEMLHTFTGTIRQTPPMFSAVKVNGKRLYEYARQGIEIERPTRLVTIYSIELLDEILNNGETTSFRFRVACSKGTYIRTLAVMIGDALGFPAHMSELSRIRSATFSLSDCFTLEEIETRMFDGTVTDILHPIETALSHLPKYVINDKITDKVKNGAVLPIPDQFKKEDHLLVLESEDGKALAIYIHHPEKPGMMKPSKVLRSVE